MPSISQPSIPASCISESFTAIRLAALGAAIGMLASIGVAPSVARGQPSVAPPSLEVLPGREDDARVERIAFRLAVAGRSRCPMLEPDLGLALQHLSQFELSDRPGMIAAQSLDRGPGVIVVVPGSPAANAGLRPGDVVLAIDGAALPPEGGVTGLWAAPFDAARAHARADVVHDLLARAGTGPFAITLLRGRTVSTVRIAPLPACPSRVHLARSNQRNAYADGRHVFLTTGLLSRMRNDDELAFIIAHEMAHNILRHAVVMRGGSVKHGLGRTLGRSGQIVRETEREADALGGELMIDAGFDPVTGVAILSRIGGSDLGIELFASHDATGRRIAAMRALAAARAQ